MIPQDEQFAEQIRQAGKEIKAAEEDLARAEAFEKQQMARLMIEAQVHGHKSAAAQTVYADATEVMFNARLERGAKKGVLAAAKANLSAAETKVRVWQTQMSIYKLENRTYGTDRRS